MRARIARAPCSRSGRWPRATRSPGAASCPTSARRSPPASPACATTTWPTSSLSTGGTGFAPRDVTPEAARATLERLSPGIDEALRADALRHTPHGALSRGVSGTRARTIVITLPGSPRACEEGWAVLEPILEHAVKLLRSEPTTHGR